MTRLRRRTVLGGVAAGLASLAGCSGGTAGSNDGDSGGSGGDEDGLELEALAVAGSPGTELTVAPTGSPVLLDFFATWCAPCKPQMSHLREIRDTEPDIAMRSLTRETDDKAIRQFWQDYQGTWPVAKDPRLLAFEAYSVSRVPVLVVLDADGSEVWRHAGLADASSIRPKVAEARA